MSHQGIRSQSRVTQGEPLGFIVHFNFKIEWEEERAKRGLVDFIDEMTKESTFINFFRLRDRTNANRVALYETWSCSKE
jgi:hypothetical protein